MQKKNISIFSCVLAGKWRSVASCLQDAHYWRVFIVDAFLRPLIPDVICACYYPQLASKCFIDNRPHRFYQLISLTYMDTLYNGYPAIRSSFFLTIQKKILGVQGSKRSYIRAHICLSWIKEFGHL
jgi:hypothetical protein